MITYQDNYIREAQITKIVDGDTFYATVDLGYCVKAEIGFRLSGINASDMSTVQGIQAKHLFVQACQDSNYVFIQSEMLIKTPNKMKQEKWRRYLATVFLLDKEMNWYNWNERLLNLGLAIPYDGTGHRD